jgi:hypothetical protein
VAGTVTLVVAMVVAVVIAVAVTISVAMVAIGGAHQHAISHICSSIHVV